MEPLEIYAILSSLFLVFEQVIAASDKLESNSTVQLIKNILTVIFKR